MRGEHNEYDEIVQEAVCNWLWGAGTVFCSADRNVWILFWFCRKV